MTATFDPALPVVLSHHYCGGESCWFASSHEALRAWRRSQVRLPRITSVRVLDGTDGARTVADLGFGDWLDALGVRD